MFSNIFFILATTSIIGAVIEYAILERFPHMKYLSPPELYRNTNMNKFGCWLVFILVSIFSPLVLLGKIVYWLCHIGRK